MRIVRVALRHRHIGQAVLFNTGSQTLDGAVGDVDRDDAPGRTDGTRQPHRQKAIAGTHVSDNGVGCDAHGRQNVWDPLPGFSRRFLLASRRRLRDRSGAGCREHRSESDDECACVASLHDHVHLHDFRSRF